jgi:hypothetical protein
MPAVRPYLRLVEPLQPTATVTLRCTKCDRARVVKSLLKRKTLADGETLACPKGEACKCGNLLVRVSVTR